VVTSQRTCTRFATILRDSTDAARRMMIRFVTAFRLLAKRPGLGCVREDLHPETRFWPVGNYLILYLVTRRPLEIVAVVHGARDVPAIMNRRLQ
jgi:plasmid stabilization system protein ParE